jgi:hypothetical protein
MAWALTKDVKWDGYPSGPAPTQIPCQDQGPRAHPTKGPSDFLDLTETGLIWPRFQYVVAQVRLTTFRAGSITIGCVVVMLLSSQCRSAEETAGRQNCRACGDNQRRIEKKMGTVEEQLLLSANSSTAGILSRRCLEEPGVRFFASFYSRGKDIRRIQDSNSHRSFPSFQPVAGNHMQRMPICRMA